MANKRILKKDISYVAGELYAEVMVRMIVVPGVDRHKADDLLSRILNMEDEYIRRANRPDAKENKALIKEYYRKLRVDLQTEVDVIVQEIAALNEEKKEKKTTKKTKETKVATEPADKKEV